MALGPRLDLRPRQSLGQSLVMTPQLQQAIKLLALSNLEVEAFIGESLEANPLLDLGGEPAASLAQDGDVPDPPRQTTLEGSAVDRLISEGRGDQDRPLDIDTAALDRDRDTGEWSADLRLGGGDERPGLEDRHHGEATLIHG